MKNCRECGKQLASNALVCPGCGKRFAHPIVKFVIYGLVGLFGIGFLSTVFRTQSLESADKSISSTPNNDADLLISRCGAPDKDDSTAYDTPRPPIPTRLITYKRAHLMFAYYPDDKKVGDPPPYTWKLLGIKDTRTNTAVKAQHLRSVLSRRLPCSMDK